MVPAPATSHHRCARPEWPAPARPAMLLGVETVLTRLASPADAEAIRAIYNAEVVGSTVTFDMVPRTREEQLAWLVTHSGAHPAIVAVEGEGNVVGFGSLSPYRSRPAYSTTVED